MAEDVDVFKANTFLASKSRVDDERMQKVKYDDNKRHYAVETFTTNDREIMLGFPKGYVEKSGELFNDRRVVYIKYLSTLTNLIQFPFYF